MRRTLNNPGGNLVRSFPASDDDGNLCHVEARELIIKSNEIRADGQSRKGRVFRYYVLKETGERLTPVEDESHAFKIVGTDKIVWELGK